MVLLTQYYNFILRASPKLDILITWRQKCFCHCTQLLSGIYVNLIEFLNRFKTDRYFPLSIFSLYNLCPIFPPWIIVIFSPCIVELNNCTRLTSASPNIWGYICFSGSQGWLTAIAGAELIVCPSQVFLILHLLPKPSTALTHTDFPLWMCHLWTSNFYFPLLLFNFPWFHVTFLPRDCCSLACLKSEQLTSISAFLVTSTVEPVSASYFQVAMRKPTGHPSEGSCATVEGREEADKCELEDPCSRQGWSPTSHLIAWPKQLLWSCSYNQPFLLSLPLKWMEG